MDDGIDVQRKTRGEAMNIGVSERQGAHRGTGVSNTTYPSLVTVGSVWLAYHAWRVFGGERRRYGELGYTVLVWMHAASGEAVSA